MHKTLIVASSEVVTLTRSKAFLIGLVLMPVLMAIAFGAQRMTKDAGGKGDRRFAVVDHTGTLFETIQGVATASNNHLADAPGAADGRLLPEAAAFPEGDGDARARLSDRVRRGELYAFVEIPADVLNPTSTGQVTYYTNHASDETLPAWLAQTVNAAIISHRFHDAHVDPSIVTRLMHQVHVDQRGLIERTAAGDRGGARIDPIRTLVIPMVMMIILVFSVMSTAPQLLNSTLEEKMSRISEVLIGSVTPFELMMGKLLGTAAVSLILATIYVAGGILVARHFGYGDVVQVSYVVWLFAFLALAICMFGSIFIAIGAACTDLKDTQAMMPPAMLVMMMPFMVWFAVARAPESPLALGLSLFPTSAPFLMLLRVAIPPGPPLWQVALSFAVTGAAAVAAVFAAGKIFRTGLLMQGKAATFAEMMRWVRNP
jgi:ABC-2 type transport system permease protein